MLFKRFSLRGFDSEFYVRRQIQGYNTDYICWVTLYQGKHIRRKVDELTVAIGTEQGVVAATEATWKLRDRIMERHGLKATD